MTLQQIRMVAVGDLRPSQRNARTHSKQQRGQIKSSIRQFGFTSLIVADDQFKILCGHARWQAAKELLLAEVPVLVMAGLSEAEKRALAIADNKIATNARWDRGVLAVELGELATLLTECDLDLRITGFEPAEIGRLVPGFGHSNGLSSEEPPKISDQAITRRGDCWHCGDHRLFCGDACDRSDWAALMGDEKATAVFADPPSPPEHADDMLRSEFADELRTWMRLAAEFSMTDSIRSIFIDWRHIGEICAAGSEVFGPVQELVVWDRLHANQGAFYRNQHKLVFIYKNDPGSRLNQIERGKRLRRRSNVWSYRSVHTLYGCGDDLPADTSLKPIALVADAIKDFTRRGDLIVDPFLRSGTTLLAAERVGRRAFGMDMDPRFIDAAIRRWRDCTDRNAILAATGQTFEEVAGHRSSENSRRT